MEIHLRPATLDDADLVANLETARMPDDPRDGVMVAYWWTHSPDATTALRLVAEKDGHASVFIAAGHGPWQVDASRFGWVRTSVHPSAWTSELYRGGISTGESWLQSEAAKISVARVRADFETELAVLADLGYREARRERFWELDLVSRRAELLAGADRARAEMRSQRINLLTLDQADDAESLRKVYELDLAATKDIPTTVPHYSLTYDEWLRMYFENPGVRKDRFWIARMGEEVVGMSLIEYPPGRGVPATEFTGTSPPFRGRGVARALKYETVAQAIELGAIRLRTDNDSQNAPILHLNAEMGYQPLTPYIELHRELASPA
jgi:GNAT superfamily N-acetyltransferase